MENKLVERKLKMADHHALIASTRGELKGGFEGDETGMTLEHDEPVGHKFYDCYLSPVGVTKNIGGGSVFEPFIHLAAI